MRVNKDEIYNLQKSKIKELVLSRLSDGDQPPYIKNVALRFGIPRHHAARLLTEIKKEISYDKRTANRAY